MRSKFSAVPNHNAMLLVSSILQENPLTRDNDVELLRECWLRQSPSEAHHINALCNMLLLGELSFPDSLTRGRRKAQEFNSSLRGNMYSRRHHMAENVKQMTFSFMNN